MQLVGSIARAKREGRFGQLNITFLHEAAGLTSNRALV
jgi:hypothetical protein